MKEQSHDSRPDDATDAALGAGTDWLVEACTDPIEPPLRIALHHRELDGKAFLLVDMPPKMQLALTTLPPKPPASAFTH